MALGVNTNIASLNAQRNLTRSQDTLNTALQRLSTGLRINSAKDDAAGLAIATRFTTQINGLNQAVRNANDGISLAQTGEAALDEITNNLQRIRELAVQSANSTNSASDRAAIDLEVQQRLDEITRIGGQTAFNGQKILDGTFGTATFQVGANVGETIDVSLSQGVKSTQLGQIASASGEVDAVVLASGELSIAIGTGDAVAITASVAGAKAGQQDYSAYAKVEAINASGVAGLTATATNSKTSDLDTIQASTLADTYSLEINGELIINETGTAGGFADITAQTAVDAINAKTGITGVTASLGGALGDRLTLTAADGRNINVDENITGATGGIETFAAGTNDIKTDYVDGTNTTSNLGSISLSAAENIVFSGTPARIGFTSTIAVDAGATLANASVTTVANANNTISRVDAALTKVSDLRSTFGSVQSRFESTIANLQTVSENLSASRSRILDADFAAETASLTRSQILQQAGISVLSQANAIPQNVLALLQ